MYNFLRYLRNSLVAVLLLSQAACGTLLYPERQGQTSGRLDPTVLILDTIGLFFFIVPGVVAFAVDFGTGTIYLPADPTSKKSTETMLTQSYHQIELSKNFTMETVNAAVATHTDVADALSNENLRIMSIESDQLLTLMGEQNHLLALNKQRLSFVDFANSAGALY
ncbi:MAG: hypothetical protein KTR32_02955 [Granulosicoccus sp.]|nr:hypothetical protein [Granulosicoccus sp.]